MSPVDTSVVLFDADGDGDLDCALGRFNLPVRLMINDGTGRFRDESSRLPGHQAWTDAIGAHDLDGDGDQDLVLGNGGYAWNEQNLVFINRGNGVFDLGNVPAQTSRTESLAIGDVDGDGDPDIVFGNSGQDELYLNDGTAGFTLASGQLVPTNTPCGGLRLVDIDGDGDLDILRGSGHWPEIFANDGTGRFADVTARYLPNRTAGAIHDIVYADFDGDGDGDILATFSRIFAPRWGLMLSNATRHVAPNEQLSVNKLVRYEFLGAPGNLMLAGISSPLPRPILLPGFGRWGLDPAGFAPLPPIVLPPSGQHDWWVRVPNVQALRGRHVAVQALDVPPVGAPHLTKFTDERIY